MSGRRRAGWQRQFRVIYVPIFSRMPRDCTPRYVGLSVGPLFTFSVFLSFLSILVLVTGILCSDSNIYQPVTIWRPRWTRTSLLIICEINCEVRTEQTDLLATPLSVLILNELNISHHDNTINYHSSE